jgi:hypothetical protein
MARKGLFWACFSLLQPNPPRNPTLLCCQFLWRLYRAKVITKIQAGITTKFRLSSPAMSSGSSLGFQRQIVVSVAGTLVMVVLAFSLVFLGYLNSRELERAEQTTRQVQNTWKVLHAESIRRLEGYTRKVLSDPGLRQAMQRRNAKALLAATRN